MPRRRANRRLRLESLCVKSVLRPPQRSSRSRHRARRASPDLSPLPAMASDAAARARYNAQQRAAKSARTAEAAPTEGARSFQLDDAAVADAVPIEAVQWMPRG